MSNGLQAAHDDVERMLSERKQVDSYVVHSLFAVVKAWQLAATEYNTCDTCPACRAALEEEVTQAELLMLLNG